MAHRKAPPGTYKVRDHFGTYRTIEIDNLLVAARHAALGRFVEQPTLSTPQHIIRQGKEAPDGASPNRLLALRFFVSFRCADVQFAVQRQSSQRDIDGAVLVGPCRAYALPVVFVALVGLNDGVRNVVGFLICHGGSP